MSLRAAIFLLPFVAFGQVPAPQPSPESDAALRARVNEFFQDFVNGKFRAAMDLVAEDTQEEYFASGKAEIKEFKITKINYEPDLQKANVVLLVKRVWNIQGHPENVDTDMSTVWILEKGKWVWTHQRDPNLWDTPMGPANIELVKQNANGAVTGIPRNITQEAVNAAASKSCNRGDSTSRRSRLRWTSLPRRGSFFIMPPRGPFSYSFRARRSPGSQPS